MNLIKSFNSYSDLIKYTKMAISKRNLFLKFLADEKQSIMRGFELERKKEYINSLITNPNTSGKEMLETIRDIDRGERLVLGSFPHDYKEYFDSIKKLDGEISLLTNGINDIDALRTKTNGEWILIISNILGNYSFCPICLNGKKILAFVKKGVKVNNLSFEDYVTLSCNKDIIYYDSANMFDKDMGNYLEQKKTLSCFFQINDEINEVLFKEYLCSLGQKRKRRK